MSYYKILRNIVADSGYTGKHIIEECNKNGTKIDKAYFSRLLNNKTSAPSEEISRQISKVCGVDERLLVIEGYIDKAPKEIKEAFISIKMMSAIAALSIFNNRIDEDMLHTLEEQMNEEPLSDFIIELIDNKSYDISTINEQVQLTAKDDNFTVNFGYPIELIKDNAMFPIIPENAKVNLKIQDKYEDGDILVVKINATKEIITRYALFQEEKVILTPINKEFKKRILNTKDILILGKVVSIITEI